MPTNHFKASDLSPHLFWEYDTTQIDIEVHKDLVILRVLEYGGTHGIITLEEGSFRTSIENPSHVAVARLSSVPY